MVDGLPRTTGDSISADDLATMKALVAKFETALFPAGRPGTETMIEEARMILVRRRTRERNFPPSMFDEAPWELLIALYIAEAENRPETLAGLTRTIKAPQTTAVRWFDYLVAQGFAERVPHPNDQRAAQVRLTDSGRSHLEDYFSALPGKPM